ncbi:DUF2786 domain-containing protein [Corynebacterium anserum]|uniref:DUF2786 domain-containing protein n=1 Tax=Corynebacterium anserum TaxID=2684406 RepID=A0A7G7YMM8_9CORY|nr:DUF2786 domain-containing protein [Corynebacterium anserum]QNH95748.1 DUF2786 domain-containing protein [Corynebacterium anserum]
MATIDTIKVKVEKLLRMATDREGTPEGDAFRDKAFELMAHYGVERSQMHSNEPHTAMHRDVDFAGTYTDMQFELFNSLASELHCQAVMFRIPRSSKVQHAVVFGCSHHVERVMLLFGLLSPQMILGATKHAQLSPNRHISSQTQKRSWMNGFISTIATRLRQIESHYADEYTQTDSASGTVTPGAIVLRDDRDKATSLAAEHFPHLRRSRSARRTWDPDSFHLGVTKGNTIDLGQTKMPTDKEALPAGGSTTQL